MSPTISYQIINNIKVPYVVFSVLGILMNRPRAPKLFCIANYATVNPNRETVFMIHHLHVFTLPHSMLFQPS